MSINKKLFGSYGGKDVFAYTLKNSSGASVTLLTYGGIINSLYVPDRNGKFSDIVCGFDSVEDYVSDKASCSGALIGRYCGRISGGGFKLNGERYDLAMNDNGKCHLHGGNVGFNRRLWDANAISGDREDRLELRLFSPDGEEGYPGNLYVKVTYVFDESNSLTIIYEAQTDRETVINLTNHAYYNLNGYDGDSVMKQEIFIDADRYDEADEILLPKGEPVPVDGTDYDFRKIRPITRPYDSNFILNGKPGEFRLSAKVCDPCFGRTMTLYTDRPALQFYTAVCMNGKTDFKGGVPQRPLHALCLETQYSTDTPNRPYLPECTLRPGEKFATKTKFVFGTY